MGAHIAAAAHVVAVHAQRAFVGQRVFLDDGECVLARQRVHQLAALRARGWPVQLRSRRRRVPRHHFLRTLVGKQWMHDGRIGAVQIEGDAAPRKHQQHGPQPQAARAVQVEHQFIAAAVAAQQP
ncbi:hypothetical protein D3C81_1688720 [compost metagenome]